jgi:transposase
LQQDEGAISAALTTPYRSAQTEGPIPKLKPIKHPLEGRANVDLRRRRVLLVA